MYFPTGPLESKADAEILSINLGGKRGLFKIWPNQNQAVVTSKKRREGKNRKFIKFCALKSEKGHKFRESRLPKKE